MNTYIEKVFSDGYWTSFWVLICAPIVLAFLYVLFSFGQNYNIMVVIKKANSKMGYSDYNTSILARIIRKFMTLFKDDKKQNTYSNMLMIALKKVNGWNLITTLYACFYYLLNFWSVAFAIFSVIVIGGDADQELELTCTVLTAVLLCTTLFLKFDHKWMVFKSILSKAKKETNVFIYRLGKCRNTYSLIKNFSNKIVSLEATLKESELL